MMTGLILTCTVCIGGFVLTSLFTFLLICIRLCAQKKTDSSIYCLQAAKELNTWLKF